MSPRARRVESKRNRIPRKRKVKPKNIRPVPILVLSETISLLLLYYYILLLSDIIIVANIIHLPDCNLQTRIDVDSWVNTLYLQRRETENG